MRSGSSVSTAVMRMGAEVVGHRVAASDVPVGTAAELEAAIGASKPLVIKGLVDHWPALTAGKTSPSALGRYPVLSSPR